MTNANIEVEGRAFLKRHQTQKSSLSNDAKRIGGDLASRLRTRAIDLCHDKSTEFSPEIGRLFELAAKVSLLSFWPDEEAMSLFERDIKNVYGLSQRSKKHSDSYDQFRKEYIKSRNA